MDMEILVPFMAAALCGFIFWFAWGKHKENFTLENPESGGGNTGMRNSVIFWCYIFWYRYIKGCYFAAQPVVSASCGRCLANLLGSALFLFQPARYT